MGFPSWEEGRKCGLPSKGYLLPRWSTWHSMFCALRKNLGSQVHAFPSLLPTDIAGEVVLEPKSLVERWMKRLGCCALTEVLVKWVGLPEEDITWELLWKLKALYPHHVARCFKWMRVVIELMNAMRRREKRLVEAEKGFETNFWILFRILYRLRHW